MTGKHCKLYDENLVRNIMISTGVSIFEYIKSKKGVDMDDICEFVELNADSIIENTIEDMNSTMEPGSPPPLPGDIPGPSIDDDELLP